MEEELTNEAEVTTSQNIEPQAFPFTDEATYGVFASTEVTVDESARTVTLSITMRHGVKKSITYPWPVLAACAFDNPDGYTLQQGKNLKP